VASRRSLPNIMTTKSFLPLLLGIALATPATAQSVRRAPDIGYLYPAGARAGTTTDVIVGGQNIRGAKWAHVSGPGVKVEVVSSYRQIRNLNGEQRSELMYQIQKRRAQLDKKPEPKVPKKLADFRKARQQKKDKEKGKVPTPIKLQGHPFLAKLPTASAREIEHFMTVALARRSKLQLNPQIAEMVTLRVTVDPKTPAGPREIRLLGATGLTNPLPFHVGRAKEVREYEPNQPGFPERKTPAPPALNPPFVINGQVMPGDIDRFQFKAKRGQALLVRTHARSLVPYLADAVPGWFQVVVALYDSEGKEVAWADDFRFHPDPVLFFQVPREGEYTIEIRDSIYRGREDFVYRIEVGEQAFITSGYPLGAKQGEQVAASLRGWNLPTHELKFDTSPGDASIRYGRLFRGSVPTNDLPYQVGTLPELTEKEPNNKYDEAKAIQLPCVINGRIDKAGDFDTYRFDGKAGEQLIAEVTGRRLQSPIDSLIRLTDDTGETLAWNDDRMDKDGHLHLGTGLLTHHADSYLHATLPSDGTWFVSISDAQNHGGPDCAYRLRLSAPQPDFELKVTPSALNVKPGGRAPIEVHVLRKDGFDGPVDLTLVGAQQGYELSGARIPAGCDRLQLILSAPVKAPFKPQSLKLRGTAKVGGSTVSNLAMPADDTMQAFLWRHLVPASEWLVWTGPPKSKSSPIQLAGQLPVRIVSGGSGEAHLKMQMWVAGQNYELALVRPPEGITISKPKKTSQGISFQISAEKDKPAVGHAGNLIIEAIGVRKVNGKKDQRWPAGYMPAIPFVIIDKAGSTPQPTPVKAPAKTAAN